MANFKMHLGVAAIGSGMVATLCLGAGLASVQEVAILSLLGTIGGLLPDIDLDHSTPTRLMFTALGLLLAFLAMFFKAAHYSVLELWLVWGATYLAVRYLAWRMFSDLTSHRGIFHSLAAALFFVFSARLSPITNLTRRASLPGWLVFSCYWVISSTWLWMKSTA